MTSAKATLAVVSAFILAPSPSVAQSTFYPRGNFVQDLSRGLEWMRCSVGQRWSLESESCTGKAIQLNHDEIAQVIVQADEQLGPGWRLPDSEELESLLCEECPPPKIDPELFPQTEPMPYWTNERNFFSPKNYWSVNSNNIFLKQPYIMHRDQKFRFLLNFRLGL